MQGHSTQEMQEILRKFCNYEKAILLLGLVIKIFKTGFLMKKTVSKSHVAQNRNLQ